MQGAWQQQQQQQWGEGKEEKEAGERVDQPGECVAVELDGVRASQARQALEAKVAGEVESELGLAVEQQQQQQLEVEEVGGEEDPELAQAQRQGEPLTDLLRPMGAWGGGTRRRSEAGAWLVALHPVIAEVVAALGE